MEAGDGAGSMLVDGSSVVLVGDGRLDSDDAGPLAAGPSGGPSHATASTASATVKGKAMRRTGRCYLRVIRELGTPA